MSTDLSIVIPTLGKSKFFDSAIASALQFKKDNIEIIVSINSSKDSLINSEFLNHHDVKWFKTNKILSIYDSWNFAINHSNGKWIFLLGDDDLLKPNFLSQVDLTKLHDFDLYCTRIETIDECGYKIGEQPPWLRRIYMKEQMLDLFFNDKFRNHQSSMIFSRKMFQLAGSFRIVGFPNGYYGDTLFHAYAFANCDSCYMAKDIEFSRRINIGQGSTAFYWRKNELNEYFNIYIDLLFKNVLLKEAVLKQYKKRKLYMKHLFERRFIIDNGKLQLYCKSEEYKKLKKEFLLKFLLWNTSYRFKIKQYYQILGRYFITRFARMIGIRI